ncbi:MAG: OsmC family protein [Candidatus Alcyoniella australis]|nr:OsmC family protein [Candidatus Alcyoniella australis]
MELNITFPGGSKVTAEYGSDSITTDQSIIEGGEGAGPSPYLCFLASIGTCAGYYVLRFCQMRGLDTENVRIKQTNTFNEETHSLSNVKIEIQVPAEFPQKYHKALVRAAEQCAVKRTLESPPSVELQTKVV